MSNNMLLRLWRNTKGFVTKRRLEDNNKLSQRITILFSLLFFQTTILHTQLQDTSNVSVHEGWNLISIPLEVSDGSVSTLFPRATSPGYSFDHGYVQEETLRYGGGYWLKFDSMETISIIGKRESSFLFELTQGWNIIGAPNEEITPEDFTPLPFENTKPNLFYEYTNGTGYSLAETLRAGKGYWVKTTESFSLWYPQWYKVGELNPGFYAVDQEEPDKLYATTQSDFSSGRHGKLFRSVNGGTTWDTLLTGADYTTIKIDPTNHNIVYVSIGVANGSTPGILKTTNGGSTWFHADSGIGLSWEMGATLHEIHPLNNNILYASSAGTWGMFPYKSTNGGMSWFPIPQDTVNCETDSLCAMFTEFNLAIDPLDTNVLYVTTLFPDYRDLLFKTINGGKTFFIDQYLPLDEAGVVEIAVSATNSNLIYIASRGILQSTDRGITWKFINAGLPDSTYIIDIIGTSDEDTIYLNISTNLYVTTNGGQFWYRGNTKKYEMWDYIYNERGRFFYGQRSDGLYKLILKH